MIRSQRRAHARIWTALAVLLPLAIGGILVLAAGQSDERAPELLEPAANGGGTGE